MKLKVLSSSSEGNCYLLTDRGGNTLVIECGVAFMDIKKALQFSIKGIVGCLVTHQHNDHSKSVVDFLKAGINVYAPESVFVAKGRKSPFAIHVSPNERFSVGEFKVMALNAFHDVPCLCYIIEHEEMGKLFIATDTYKLPYKVKGLNHFLIECNYCDDVLDLREQNGDCPKSLRDRLMLTHMELKTTLKCIKNNIDSLLQDIILLHLSHDNSSIGEMTNAIAAECGVATFVAENGFEIELNKEPY